jgi:hypothetical protein
MRLIHFAGMPGSGKTQIIKSSGVLSSDCAVILNNDGSSSLIDGMCGHIDVFPFKSPCARVRQYQFRIDLILDKFEPAVMVTEPPGNCMEVSSPMINSLYVSKKDVIDFAPLFSVIDGATILTTGASKRTTDGLRVFNMIDESDAVVVSKSDLLNDDERSRISELVVSLNEDATVVFTSVVTGEGLDTIKELALGDREYYRPLVN